ncbi:multidrug DMT transporter permease [Legionella impletisoli]|uniref:Multidrug DMT transporter permease n=1 Tax=Legionella impletisoli TaxID=343510 RepID=A0A917N935_9GAMM|nr:multidrug DMT transporter permease [Legionella impletisoli]GGI78547.1 multidrug DMT transporter permease [Legionella impletisoli]
MSRMLVLLICIVSFFGNIEASTPNTQACKPDLCVAVVDAGSTGTRLHIYSFERNENNLPINIQEIWSKKIRPGFATLEPSQDTVNAYLHILFSDAPASNLPVYFYATAGMRLLSGPKQDTYYNALKQWFKHHPQWRLVDSKTITGREEGLFGWLSVNYQLKTLQENKPEAYVSVMDMGGASVQIVFPVKNTENINPDDLVEVDVYGQKTKLFVHSFLGLGQTVFAYQFLDEKSCFADNYKLPSGVSGQGDAQECQADVSKLINEVHQVSTKVQPALAENQAEKWYVLGGIKFLLEDKPFHFEGDKFNSEELLEQGNIEVCNKSWQELTTQNPHHEFLYNYCLLPSYYYALIVNGYGLNAEEPIYMLPGQNSADWTLGVVLHQH